jgi:hypothetical protein
MISYEEMPNDNVELAEVVIDFPLLQPNDAESCPLSMETILDYLNEESSDGDGIQAGQLKFLRTALVAEKRYWIWSFQDSDGSDCFVTASWSPNGNAEIGYDENDYDLTPEQFMLGDYHDVF